MKRFWNEVSVAEEGDGFVVRLDERVLKTPARHDLLLPSERVAEAIAAEWRGVEDKIAPDAMPMTGLANAAIDRIAPDPEPFAEELARFGENELCCYRANHPQALVERQEAAWDPLLDWASKYYAIDFETTAGVMHVAQPGETLERLREALARENAFVLAGLSHLVRNGGSLIAALAVRHRAVTPEDAFDAVEVDRAFQEEQWGADEEAARAAAARREDFDAGANFIRLL